MRRAVFIVILTGALAGIVGHAMSWIFGTAEVARSIPWLTHLPEFAPQPADWLKQALAIALGVAFCWIGFAIGSLSKKLGLLLAAVVLCFTASLALSRHGHYFDPIPTAIAVLLGWVGGVWLGRGQLALAAEFPTIFQNRLAPERIRQLSARWPLPELHCENRPVVAVACVLLNHEAVRQVMGPAAFLRCAEELRQAAAQVLLKRGGLLVPISGEGLEACFGLPVPGEHDAAAACEAASLACGALREIIGQLSPNSGGDLEVGFGVATGLAASGMINGVYEISGQVLQDAQRLATWNARWATGVLADDATVRSAGDLLRRPIFFPEMAEKDPAGTTAWEIIPKSDADQDQESLQVRLKAFAEGIELLQAKRWPRAAEEFARSQPKDAATDLTALRFQQFAEQKCQGGKSRK